MANARPTPHRWDDLTPDTPMELLERRLVVGRRAMVAHITMRKGCHVPTHQHGNEQFVCVLSGRIRLGLGPEGSPQRDEVTLDAGGVICIPSNYPHSADALEDTVVLDVFSPPSETTGIDRAS
jgi:quercetin dioxygenase-like cupin family protein